MTWIKTIPFQEATEPLQKAMMAMRTLYPPEYGTTVELPNGSTDSIVASHSLIPDALNHAFSTYGVLLSPDLPLSRRQHEMIATVVSAINRCYY